jgi:glycosyltransferase involved in cell wall biosynthesis
VFTPATEESARPLTLLLGGTQYQRYRIDLALQTLAAISNTIPDARLIVTGKLRWSGNSAPDQWARDRARSLGVFDRVEFVGPYSQQQAPEIFRRADVLLHPKYNDPCPTTVIEAMACGLPVVYSRTGGVPELVSDDAGVGVASPISFDEDHPPSAEALAAAVLTVTSDRERYAERARARAVEHFDVKPWVERHATVFNELVKT